MGYKRMKKKKDMEYERAMNRLGFRNLGIVVLGPQVQPKKDNSERMKWFESPNAEGYLDM